MGTKLYVGNLSFNTTENELQELFAQAGTVQEVYPHARQIHRQIAWLCVCHDGFRRGRSKRHLEIQWPNVEGRPLTVNEARPREPRPPGGGGRGYGGGGGGYGGRREGGGGGQRRSY